MAERRPAPKKPGTRRQLGTHEVQSVVEGITVDDEQKVEMLGATFRIAESIGLMPLLRFAHASSKGLDSTDMEGMAALYEMIRDCIDQTRPQHKGPDGKMVDAGPSEWERFQTHAVDTKAEADDLLAVVQKVIEVLGARPTRPRPGSSAGQRPISGNSKGSLSSPVIEGMSAVDDLGRST